MQFYLVRVDGETYPIMIPSNAPLYGVDHRGHNIPLAVEEYLIDKFSKAFNVNPETILLKEIK